MIISEKVKKYLKEKDIKYIVINVKRDENFSGCGCSSDSVVTYSPKAEIAYKIEEENYIIREVDGIKIAIKEEVESTLKDNTKIDLIGLFSKSLFIEGYVPKVIK